MPRQPETRWIVPENLTEEEVAEGQKALEDLAKLLGRKSAEACIRLGITFDMDDPQVAHEVMLATFDALFLPQARRPATKQTKAKSRVRVPRSG